MNLPNCLSLGRIAVAPALWVLLAEPSRSGLHGDPAAYVALGAFLLAAATDWFDGYIARTRGQVTAFGQFLDPFADKILTCAALIALSERGSIPTSAVAIIIAREFAITLWRVLLSRSGRSLPASSLGKLKMATQVVAIALLIPASGPIPSLMPAAYVALWAAVGASLASGLQYLRPTRRDLVSVLPGSRPTASSSLLVTGRRVASTSHGTLR